MAVPLAPLVLGGTALFIVLLSPHSSCSAPRRDRYSPCPRASSRPGFRSRHWALAQGVQSSGANLGAALVPPLVAWLMCVFDWQRALIWTRCRRARCSRCGGAGTARNTPAEHAAVTAAELAELDDAAAPDRSAHHAASASGRVLKNRDVLLLTFAYPCMNYTFYLLLNWCFLYLVQERHFALLEGGFLASAPPIGSGPGADPRRPAGRHRWSARFGLRAGLRTMPLIALPASGLAADRSRCTRPAPTSPSRHSRCALRRSR